MMKKGKEYRQFYLFGIMSAVLGFGFYIPVVLLADKVLNISFFKSASDIQKPYRDHRYLHHL